MAYLLGDGLLFFFIFLIILRLAWDCEHYKRASKARVRVVYVRDKSLVSTNLGRGITLILPSLPLDRIDSNSLGVSPVDFAVTGSCLPPCCSVYKKCSLFTGYRRGPSFLEPAEGCDERKSAILRMEQPHQLSLHCRGEFFGIGGSTRRVTALQNLTPVSREEKAKPKARMGGWIESEVLDIVLHSVI